MNDGRISVLYFTNVLARGGAEEHILTLLRGLDRSRFRLGLICPPIVANKLRPDLPADVHVTELCLRKPTEWGTALRVANALRKFRADILHSHLFYSSLFASPIGKSCRVPVIIETPHVAEVWRKTWFKSHFFVDRAVGCCVDYYIAVSEANARYLIQQKGLPERKVVVIQNGSDLSRFSPERAAPVGLRQSLGFGPDDPVLILLGRLEPQKGHRILFQALPLVREHFPTTRVVCLGDGVLRSELEQQVKQAGLQEAVRFLGFQPNPEDWLAMADISVLPSFFEGLPLAAIESLAAGRAVVATAVDGTPEVVVNRKTGLTVPAGDPPALAEAILALLRDPGLREQLAQAGRHWVLDRFNQSRQIQLTQELYLHAWKEARERTKGRTAGQTAKLAAAVRPQVDQRPRTR